MEFGSEVLYSSDKKEPEYELISESRFNHVVQAVSSGYSSVSDDYDDDSEVGTKLKAWATNWYAFILADVLADVPPRHFGHRRSRRVFGYERPSKKRILVLVTI